MKMIKSRLKHNSITLIFIEYEIYSEVRGTLDMCVDFPLINVGLNS